MASLARRPDGRWRARYRGPDRRERTRHFSRKVDAERWLAGVEVAKARGEWIDPARASVRLEVFAPQWLAAQQQLKPTTRTRYEGLLRRQVLPTWGPVALGDVTTADVAAWVRRLSDDGLAAGTVRYAHRTLSLMLAWAVLDGRLSRNPATGVPLPRARARERRYLSHGEVERLALACEPWSTLIYVLAYTGLRWGEVAALRVGDVDLMRRRLSVRRAMVEVSGRAVVGTPKDHETREVPVPRFLVDPLTTACAGREPDALVFPAEGGAFLRNTNFRRRVFDPAARRAEVDGVTPHGLRHTAASLAIQAGATVVLVQRMLGHSSPTVTLNVYSHLFADDLDVLADRLDEARSRAGADQVRTDGQVIMLGEPSQEDRDAV